MEQFFENLRQRKLVQWALAYIAAAFALIQIIDIVAQRFGWPESAERFAIIAFALGFFVTLVLAWYHGERGAQRVTGTELSILTLLLAIGGGLLWRLAPTANAPERHASDATSAAKAPVSAANVPADSKSIAVLPFENLSDDKANAYFADGIQDEILTRLAKIGALKVISRTSTQQYAAKPGNLMEIAKQLAVANLLEGSVQKIGNQAHINVQLIRASTDEHLWAESYNRKLDDVFAVEGEVAQTVADALNAKLSAAEQKAVTAKPTDSPAAYDAYARGRAIEANTYSYLEGQKAQDAYYEAVRLDPKFALAWAHASIAGGFLHFNGIETPHSTAQAILQAADTALSLQPDLGEGWLAQGYYRYRVLRDPASALQAFETAHQHLPNSAQVLSAIERVERRLGRWDQAVQHKREAIELDPLNIQVMMEMSNELLVYLRRFDEARTVLDRAHSIAPANITVLCQRAQIEQLDGRLDAAARVLAGVPDDTSSYDLLISYSPLVQSLYERHYDKAITQAVKYLPAGGQPIPRTNAMVVVLMLAQAQAWSGRSSEARATYERIVRSIKPSADAKIPIDEVQLPSILALAYAGLGDKRAALDAARAAIEPYRDDAMDRVLAEIAQAEVQAQVGEHDAAIAALPKLLEVPAGLTVAQLRYDPIWDPLRKDSRFQKLTADGETQTKAQAAP